MFGMFESYEENEPVLMKRTVISAPKPPKIRETIEPAKNYGADISTLQRLIDSGEF